MILKLITINLGLLDYKFFGETIFYNPYYSNERIKFIPQSLLKYNAYIIVIQECYDKMHFKFISNNLKFRAVRILNAGF